MLFSLPELLLVISLTLLIFRHSAHTCPQDPVLPESDSEQLCLPTRPHHPRMHVSRARNDTCRAQMVNKWPT